MSVARLQAQCLPPGSRSTFIRVFVNDKLVGHVFGCRWLYKSQQVLWITQLVVHKEYRERRLATMLLSSFFYDRNERDVIFGIMSSHAAACKTLVKAFGSKIDILLQTNCSSYLIQRFIDFLLPNARLDFTQEHAAGIMEASPIPYVREAKLRGRTFERDDDKTGLVCGVDTGFYVDHAEPLRALTWLQEGGDWPLGNLPDGHEFLMLFLNNKSHRLEDENMSSIS